MATETIEERIPMTKVRDDLDAVFERARETKRPIAVTQEGKEAVIIVDAVQYRKDMEERELLRGILAGEDDIRNGRSVSHEEVEAMLDELLAE